MGEQGQTERDSGRDRARCYTNQGGGEAGRGSYHGGVGAEGGEEIELFTE